MHRLHAQNAVLGMYGLKDEGSFGYLQGNPDS